MSAFLAALGIATLVCGGIVGAVLLYMRYLDRNNINPFE